MGISLEIVCVGNELLIGKIVNTNASWLGNRITFLGLSVKRITVAPDEIDEIARVVGEVLDRKPSFVIITGGLGPTFDDKTLQGIAVALNRKLSVNKDALSMVRSKYENYAKVQNNEAIEITPSRVKMATLPEDAKPLSNPVGTAPGIQIILEGTVLFALPGVPAEMKAIFEESLAPLLRKESGDVGFFELSVFADKIMESALSPAIDSVMNENPSVYIKSHPKGKENEPHIELHLSTSGKPSENPQEMLAKAALQLSALIEKAGGEVIKVESQGKV